MEFLDDKELPEEESFFLKLKDKEEVTGVFRGEIYHFYHHYVKGENKSYLCVGKDDCPYCLKGKPSFRFKINIVIKDASGSLTAKIFESGITLYKQLKELNKRYEDLNRVFVTLTRHGSDTKTTYSIIPLPNWQVNSNAERAISQVKLHELKHAEMKEKGKPEMAHSMGEEDLPF